jgi:hypothetical protein
VEHRDFVVYSVIPQPRTLPTPQQEHLLLSTQMR